MIFTPILKVWQLINQHELISLFVLLTLEEAGIPLPVPGDIILVNVGRLPPHDWRSFWEVLAVASAGSILGASILYAVARKFGRDLVFKYLKFLHLEREKVGKVERWLRARGGRVIILGRLVPGLRMMTSLAAGFFRIPYFIFIFYTTLGTIFWVPIYFLLGWWIGDDFLRLVKFFSSRHLYFIYPLVFVAGFFIAKHLINKAFNEIEKE